MVPFKRFFCIDTLGIIWLCVGVAELIIALDELVQRTGLYKKSAFTSLVSPDLVLKLLKSLFYSIFSRNRVEYVRVRG